jgi:hypothetical protein
MKISVILAEFGSILINTILSNTIFSNTINGVFFCVSYIIEQIRYVEEKAP